MGGLLPGAVFSRPGGGCGGGAAPPPHSRLERPSRRGPPAGPSDQANVPVDEFSGLRAYANDEQYLRPITHLLKEAFRLDSNAGDQVVIFKKAEEWLLVRRWK